MKLFLKYRVWLFLFFTCLLAGAIVVSCTDSGQETSSSSSSSSGGTSSDTNEDAKDDDEPLLSCSLPDCSGSDCCSKDDDDCDGWCTDKKHLDLSGKAATKCLSLEEDVVKDLAEIFAILKKATADKLDGLDDDDIELICAGVKELDAGLWGDLIDDYSASKAKRVLNWMSNNEAIVEVFENAEDDDGIEMFKDLLKKAAGGAEDGYAKILKGLETVVNTSADADDRRPLIALAAKDGRDRLVRYIHEELIVDEDEGICGQSSNRPVADGASSYLSGEVTEADKNFKEEACILAVYCTIDKHIVSSDQNKFRKNIADTVDSGDVTSFISTDQIDGGLDPTSPGANAVAIDDDDADEWSDNACKNLKHFWKDGLTGLDI